MKVVFVFVTRFCCNPLKPLCNIPPCIHSVFTHNTDHHSRSAAPPWLQLLPLWILHLLC